MNDLLTIKNVRGYIDNNGVAQLNLEDVARGLGFTTVATSGNEVVRWARVDGYLSDLGFGTSAKNKFIPENIFYRLAMKAKNETAEKFQAIVADEILPTIRKHGAYMTPQKIEEVLMNPDTIIQLATTLKEEKEKRLQAELKIQEDKPKVLFADAVSASKTTILIGELAKLLKQNGVDIGEKRLFERLRDKGYLISRKGADRNSPTQKSMELDLFTVKETAITHSDGHTTISKTTKVTGKGQQYFINKFLTEKSKLN